METPANFDRQGNEEGSAKQRWGKVTIRVCMDGARRGSGSGSAGTSIAAYFLDGSQHVAHRAGIMLGVLQSAFVAETLALELDLQRCA